MTDKERTWPASVCVDPETETLHNARAIDGHCVFKPGVSKGIARQACEATNQHFDHGRRANDART